MKIFFDLDGTLLDSKLRFYTLFQDLVPKSNLTFDEYWAIKSFRIDHESILRRTFKYSESTVAVFKEDWDSLVETDKYLNLDTIILGTVEVLANFKVSNQLYILTARRCYENTIKQLERLQIIKYFDKVITTGGEGTKIESIKNFVQDEKFVMVGDTELDILTGKHYNAVTVAVASGVTDRKILNYFKPDYVLGSVRDILTLNL